MATKKQPCVRCDKDTFFVYRDESNGNTDGETKAICQKSECQSYLKELNVQRNSGRKFILIDEW